MFDKLDITQLVEDLLLASEIGDEGVIKQTKELLIKNFTKEEREAEFLTF